MSESKNQLKKSPPSYYAGWLFNKISNVAFIMSVVSFLNGLETFRQIREFFYEALGEIRIFLERLGDFVSMLVRPYVVSRDYVLDLLQVSLSSAQADALFISSLLFSIWLSKLYAGFAGSMYKTAFIYYMLLKQMISQSSDAKDPKALSKSIRTLVEKNKLGHLAAGPVEDLARGLDAGMKGEYLSDRIRAADQTINYAFENLGTAFAAEITDYDQGFRGIKLKVYVSSVLLCLFVINYLLSGQSVEIIRIALFIPSFAFTIMVAFFGFYFAIVILALLIFLAIALISKWFPNSSVAKKVGEPLAKFFRTIYLVSFWSPASGTPPKIDSMSPNFGEAEVFQSTLKDGSSCLVFKHSKDLSYSMIKGITFQVSVSKVTFHAATGRTFLGSGSIKVLNELKNLQTGRVNIQFCPDEAIVDSVWRPVEILP